MKKITILFFFLLAICFSGFSQLRDSFERSKVYLPNFSYTYAKPLGIYGERFGIANAVGAGLTFKTKSNWLIGAEYNVYFGSNVKENILKNLYASGDGIINTEGVYDEIKLYHRGFYTMVHLGRVFPLGVNENSGIVFKFGVGAIQHKIKMVYEEMFLPALSGDSYKGYDRLTNGVMTYQFLGYQLLDPRRRLDFFIGVDLLQGFTQNRRSWNWDTRERDTRKRTDVQLGLKAGIIVPIYKKSKSEELFFDD